MANMMQNAQQKPTAQKVKFSVALQSDKYQKLINDTLKEPGRAARFIASISSAVAVNPALQACEASSILAGSLLGESMNLSPSPQLGHYYLVPFEQKEKRDRQGNVIRQATTTAVFVCGYKGMIQLALRSGQYRKLNVIEVKQGEMQGFDYFNEEPIGFELNPSADREKMPTVGYIAFFEYLNGFRKTMYWSKEQMIAHADKYSAAFSASAYIKLMNGEIPESEKWKYSSYWYKDFDGMAKKTMLRQLIGKWGIMSTEMVKMFESDDKTIKSDSKGNLFADDMPAEEVSPVVEVPAEEVRVNETVDLSAL